MQASLNLINKEHVIDFKFLGSFSNHFYKVGELEI